VSTGAIGEYTTSGATVNAALISGLSGQVAWQYLALPSPKPPLG
jgi:hypothetical protein